MLQPLSNYLMLIKELVAAAAAAARRNDEWMMRCKQQREGGLTGLRMRDAGAHTTYIKALWLLSWAKNRSISHFSNLKRNYIYEHFCLCSWWVKCKYWISFLQISNIQYHLLRTFCSSWWGQKLKKVRCHILLQKIRYLFLDIIWYVYIYIRLSFNGLTLFFNLEIKNS